MSEVRVPKGVPTGGQFATSTRRESRINLNSPGMADQPPPAAPAPSLHEQVVRSLEKQMGCAPGEMIVQNGHGPYGEPIQVPLGHMCTSSAHNHAYWRGTCEFAEDMAITALGIVQPRLDAAETRADVAEAKLTRIDETFDSWVASGSITGNYDADMAAGQATYHASGFVKAVIDGTVDTPTPEPSENPWAPSDPDEPPF